MQPKVSLRIIDERSIKIKAFSCAFSSRKDEVFGF